MATFPTARPSYLGFTATHTLAADTHAAQHNAEQADISALSDKVGLSASTPSTGNVLTATGTGTSAWAQVDLPTMVTGQLPIANSSLVLAAIYPVGCIYTETTGVNPGTTFGFGTWIAFGAGRVLVGNGSSDQPFAAGATGGESNHLLASNEMPSHTHTVTDPGHTHTVTLPATATSGGTVGYFATNNTGAGAPATSTNTTGITNQNTGGGAVHNNLQPYIVVYFWQRTA